MTFIYCPRCNQRVNIPEHTGDDYCHVCSSQSEVLDNEDVVVIGKHNDYTGSNTVVNDVNLQGMANKLWGTRAAVEGEKSYDLTSRGNRKATHRTRQHIEFIEIKK